MKLKKFKFKQILKLHLLNSRAYEYATKKATSRTLNELDLTQTISDFKRALQVIFQYHQADKQILFIGVPKKLEIKINKLTQHIAIPSDLDAQGVIFNTFKPEKLLKTPKETASKLYLKTLLPKLSKKSDLIVLLSHDKPQVIVTESYVAKIPLINFISTNEKFKNGFNSNFYSLNGFGGDQNFLANKNLLYLGFNFLFKTAVKRSFKKQNLKSKYSQTRKNFK